MLVHEFFSSYGERQQVLPQITQNCTKEHPWKRLSTWRKKRPKEKTWKQQPREACVVNYERNASNDYRPSVSHFVFRADVPWAGKMKKTPGSWSNRFIEPISLTTPAKRLLSTTCSRWGMSWLQSTVNHSNEGSYCYQWYASNTEQNQVSAFYWPRKSVSHGMCDAYATSCLFKMNTLVYYYNNNNNSVIRRSATTECQVNRWIVPIIQIVPNLYFEITLPWMILFYEKQFKVPPTYLKGEIFKSLKIQFLPN